MVQVVQADAVVVAVVAAVARLLALHDFGSDKNRCLTTI